MSLVADRILSTSSLEDVDGDVDDGVPLQAKSLDELMSNIENVMKKIHISDRETILQQLSNSFQLSKSTWCSRMLERILIISLKYCEYNYECRLYHSLISSNRTKY